MQELALARDYFIEIAYRGVEIINLKIRFKFIKTGELEDLEKFKKSIAGHFKPDAATDELLFAALFEKYATEQVDSNIYTLFQGANLFSFRGVFKSFFANEASLEDLLNSSTKNSKNYLKTPHSK